MKRDIASYTALMLIVSALLTVVLSSHISIDESAYSTEGLVLNYTVEKNLPTIEQKVAIPYLGKTFVGFKEALAFKESQGNYFSVNTYGYMGKYQFGKETLKMIGVYDSCEFLNSPQLQEKAFIANTSRNKWILRRDIKRFVGKRINGILVTESGILAAAHLSGAGSVKKYLRSYGAIGFSDAYGTTIENYLKKFSGYDMSFIKPNRKAKALFL